MQTRLAVLLAKRRQSDVEREVGAACTSRAGGKRTSTMGAGAQCGAGHGCEEGARNNYSYNMQQKREGEREQGWKAFKSVKFMRAMEAQIEIISLCADK